MTARLCAVLALCCLATAEKRPQTAYQTGLFKADKDKVIRLSGAISFQSEDTYGYAGRMVANGWDMFINWVNVARGPLTVNGLNYSFGLNYVEDYSDAAYVSDAFSQFISDGESSFYLGPYSSGLNAAAVAQTEPAGGLFVTAAASNSSIFKDNTYSFSLHPPDYELEEIAFKTFSGLGATSIAVAFEKGYPQCSNASESARLAAKYGLRLAGYYYTDPSSPSYEQDVDAVISSMKEQSAESAFICSYLDLCVQSVKSSKKLDFNPAGMMLSTCLDNSNFFSAVKEDAVHLMMPTPWVSTLDIVDPFTGWTPAEFSDRFYTRYGEYPEFYAAGGFTSGIILMNAVDRMQSFDPAEIAAALKEMNVLTIYGNVSFNEDNMYGGSVLLVQVQSGALNTAMVLPYAAPNASLVYPMPTWTQKQCAFETSDCSGHGACNTEGVCVCDPPQYYGTSGSGSCETFCDGELDSDAETGASFCKEVRTFYVGGLSPLDRSDNEEISAVIKLAVELVNNNTDGFFDGDLQQVLFEIRVISIVCSEEAGYSGAEALDSWAEQKGSLLTGIVGPYCSTASVGVGGREQSYTTPQISYGSTAIMLSDKNDFSSFARTCLPDNVQGYLLADLLYRLHLYDIAIVSTEDTYSSSLADLIISSYQDRNGTLLLHIPYNRNYGANASVYDLIMSALATTGAPVIVLATVRTEVEALFAARLRHPVMYSDQFLWVGVDDWINADGLDIPIGTIGLVPQPLDDVYDVGSDFMKVWQSVDPAEYPDTDGDRSTLSTYAGYAVDAVFGIALAHQAVIDSNFEGTDSELGTDVYLELINSILFIGVTGQVDFDANGDRLYAHYDVLNVDSSGSNWVKVGYTLTLDSGSYGTVLDTSVLTWPDSSVGSTASRQDYTQQYVPYCPPGYEPLYSAATNTYVCTACLVGYYKPYSDQSMCELCPDGAVCTDVAVAVPCVAPGYWRPQPPAGKEGDFDKYELYKCDRDDRCNGGCILNDTCSNVFKQDSPVCGVCKEGFYQSSFEGCSKCPGNVAFLNAMETLFAIGTILVTLLFLFTLYASYVSSSLNIKLSDLVFGTVSSDKQSLSESAKSDAPTTRATNRLITTLRVSSTRLSAALSSAKSSGLFVTVKLTVSFVQVLVGSLSIIDVNWSFSLHNFISSVQYSPLQSIPLFSGCREGGGNGQEPPLDTVYSTALVVLTLPIGFVVSAFLISRLVLSRAIAFGLKKDAVAKTVQDILIKSYVWFSLFSFPILSSSTLSYFNCREFGFMGSFMRSDYSVQCSNNDEYSYFLIVAVINTVLYPIGIPVFFYCLIRARNESWAAVASAPLHFNFTRSWAYFEVFELFRKLLLTSIVAFVLPASASQCLFLFSVDIMALIVLSTCRPYKTDSDDMLSGALITVECTIFMIAFLIVSDVYVVDDYNKSEMLDTALSLIIVALVFMVPLNIITKIPSLDKKFQYFKNSVSQAIAGFGISLQVLRQLDARSRHSDEVRDSTMEMKDRDRRPFHKTAVDRESSPDNDDFSATTVDCDNLSDADRI